MSNIYLVGFMGTGKTTLGKALAQRKKMIFLDLDELIELRERMTIPDLFARRGEEYFRRAETRALKEAAQERNFVIACGGGAVIREENVRLMKESGVVVCLTARPRDILARTGTCSHRPLLNVPDPQTRIRTLLAQRAPYYARADLTVETSGKSVSAALAALVKVLTRSAPHRPKAGRPTQTRSVRTAKSRST